MNTPTTSTPEPARLPDCQNGPLSLAFAAVAEAAKNRQPLGIYHPEQVKELADWHRRAWQETHSPYQCLWRDRAQTAEAKLIETEKEVGLLNSVLWETRQEVKRLTERDAALQPWICDACGMRHALPSAICMTPGCDCETKHRAPL